MASRYQYIFIAVITGACVSCRIVCSHHGWVTWSAIEILPWMNTGLARMMASSTIRIILIIVINTGTLGVWIELSISGTCITCTTLSASGTRIMASFTSEISLNRISCIRTLCIAKIINFVVVGIRRLAISHIKVKAWYIIIVRGFGWVKSDIVNCEIELDIIPHWKWL